MSLDLLQPPPPKQKEVLQQMILKLTKHEFVLKEFTATGKSTTDLGNSEITGTHGADVSTKANESKEVFAL